MSKQENSTGVAPVVFERDGEVFADSRDVAEHFGKQHGHVIRAIERKMENLTVQKGNVWFRPSFFMQQTGFGERRMPCYEMTRKGFSILVMGFTGAKAAAFQVAYVEAFEAMEEELRRQAEAGPVLPDFTNPALAARAWADEIEKKQEALAKVAVRQVQKIATKI